jgi:photosystem II stability/assembly factor-like uncharacterized protein
MKPLWLAIVLCAMHVSVARAQWRPQAVGTKSDFRGLSVVNSRCAWVSGTRGTFARTADGGETWSVGTVAGADKLDFRDVEAFGETIAYLLSAGPGEASRIYKTTDGGTSWIEQFRATDPSSFLDALAFWDKEHGMALGDPVSGRFELLITDDGGAHWKPLAKENRPAALPGEGAFAASGTCVIARGEGDAWFATGGAKVARVFRSSDRGRHWEASETPIVAGVQSAGIFGIGFRDARHGLIVGGDYRKPNDAGANAAATTDGGKTWTLLDRGLPFSSAVVWAKDRWVAVGTSGSHVSLEQGATWQRLDRENYNSVAFAAEGVGWAVGPKGRIAKFVR